MGSVEDGDFGLWLFDPYQEKWMRLITLALPIAATIGCTSSATTTLPPIEELEQGVNLIDVSDPSWGLTAAYVKGERLVYMEQRVGALKPQVYRDVAPDEPPNEIDMRFLDKDGKTFFVQRGGDEYVAPSWNADIRDALLNPAPDAQRIEDFKLAREAAGELARKISSVHELTVFQYHADVYAARPAPSEDPEMIRRAEQINALRPTGVAYANWNGGGGWYLLQGDLYDKKTCFAWYCGARHSGVAMYFYDTSWKLAINACNHGSCPGASNMTYQCSSSSGRWVSNVTLTGEHSTGGSVGAGCATPYSWDSGGYNHLCNDDSAYELWQIKNGHAGWNDPNAWQDGNQYYFRYNGAGTGGDGSWVNYSCDCSRNNGCNNDWSRPICP